MTIRMLSGLVLGMLMAAAAQAECAYPKEPANLPDGATATQEQMVEGMKAVKEYNGQVTAYLGCLEQEMNARVEAAGPDAPAEQIEQIKVDGTYGPQTRSAMLHRLDPFEGDQDPDVCGRLGW